MQEKQLSSSNSFFQYTDFIDLILCPQQELPKHQNWAVSSKSTTSLLQSHSCLASSTHFDIDNSKISTLPTDLNTCFQTQTSKKNSTQNQDITYQRFQLESQSEYEGELAAPKAKEKNSNSIKKIGRIILDHISEYSHSQTPNTSLHDMINLLSHSKKGEPLEQYKKRDRFNTHNLRMLLACQDKRLAKFNLLTTRKLLTKYLRKEVLRSDQIRQSSKLVYMNTMKCSALRSVNPNLAVRLQMSAEIK